jgi:hypothetical protein
MSAESWLYSRSLPRNEFSIPTQATAFGTSSLVATAPTEYVIDPGSQIYSLYPATQGNGNTPNLIVRSEDKSDLGVQTVRSAMGVRFSKPDPLIPSVPNVDSLDSKYRYYPPFK